MCEKDGENMALKNEHRCYFLYDKLNKTKYFCLIFKCVSLQTLHHNILPICDSIFVDKPNMTPHYLWKIQIFPKEGNWTLFAAIAFILGTQTDFIAENIKIKFRFASLFCDLCKTKAVKLKASWSAGVK